MIYQLPNGRIIELSVEQFLDLNDTELKDLNGLSTAYSHECSNPFYNLFCKSTNDKEVSMVESLLEDEDFSQDLFEVDVQEKLDDQYFHRDDT